MAKYFILVFIIIPIIFNSCITSSYAWKDYSKDDAIYFEFYSNDTILDYAGRNLFFDNYLFSQNNSLHFYITTKSREADQDAINKYSKNKFVNNFKESVNLISTNEDEISLSSNSVNKVLLTKIDLDYNNIDRVLSEANRILKPTGSIIVSVSTIQNRNLNQYQNEKSILRFFESKGYKILKNKTYTKEGKNGVYAIIILEKKMES